MPLGTKLKTLRAAFLVSLALPGACTDNAPSRDVNGGPTKDAGAGSGGTGAKPPDASGGTAGTAGTTGGASGASGSDAGPSVDACLPECNDPNGCELTPLEQAEVDFCRLYAKRCPDQPADVLMDPGPGKSVPAGPVAPSTLARPQLGEAEADGLYTLEKTFEAGGIYTVSYSGGGTGGDAAGAGGEGGDGTGAGGEGGSGVSEPLGERTLSYTSEDDWDPRGDIEDVTKIVPGLVVDPDGDPEMDGTYKTIQSAISAAVVVAGCPRVFIKVMPGTYREKITVPAKTSSPPVTLYGVDRDPSQIVIVAGHSAAGAEGDGTPLTIHQSATFSNSLPQAFQARNLTIANDYVAGTWPGDAESQTAVALLNQGDRAAFDNVRIVGHRNTLYVKSTGTNEVARAYFRNCYIEGDEDIILGRGAAVIDGCRIHSLGDRVSSGAIAAPSTRVDNPHGLLIINSQFTADASVSDVYLGHQWYEGETEEAVGKTIVRNSILGAHIRLGDPWAPTLRLTPNNPTLPEPLVLYTSDDYYAPGTGLIPPEIFVAEFGNSGPGAAQ